MSFPLPMLPTIPQDLRTIDTRETLAYEMAFMKNTLLRGLNNIFARAETVSKESAQVGPFWEYVRAFCDVLLADLRGDEDFFRNPCGEKADVVLVEILPGCVPDLGGVAKCVEELKAAAVVGLKNSDVYDGKALAERLTFGGELHAKWKEQLSAVDSKRLGEVLSNDEMRGMINKIVHWFISYSDIEYLFPYIFAHHDRATSEHWPPRAPESMALLEGLVEKHATCWEFAPFHPVSGEKQ